MQAARPRLATMAWNALGWLQCAAVTGQQRYGVGVNVFVRGCLV